jgi:hypothetical protein
MNLKQINANIALIGRNYNKVNALVQTTALAILAHAQEHGDCTPALRLVQAMPKSARRGLLINWFAKYSPIGMNVNKGKVGFHKEGSKLYRPFNVKEATANPWYEGEEANKEDLPDTTLEAVNKGIFALAGRFKKLLDEGSVANDDIPAVEQRIADLIAIGKKAYKPVKQAAPEKAAAN